MNKIIVQMKSYYVQEFLNVKETWRKSFKIAVVILLVENIQMLSIYTQKLNDFEYDQFLNHIRNFIDYFRFYTLFGNSINFRIIFVITGFLLQSLLILLLLGQIFNLKVLTIKNQDLQFLSIEQNFETRAENNQFINLILSFFFQTHPGILQIPLLFCGFSLITDLFNFQSINYFEWVGVIFGIMTIAQQITIGSLINLHQFDHRMKNYDFLGKFQQQRIHFLYAFQLLVIFLSGIQASVLIVQTLGIIKSVIQIICDYNQEVYIDYRISRLNLRIVVITLIYQLLLMICQYGQPTLKISIVLLILLFYPPLIFLTNEILIRQDLKNANYQSRDLEKYIRRLYIIFKQQVELKKQQRLLDPRQSLEIYTFISSHLRECKIQRERKLSKNIKLKYKCFCQDFFTNMDTFQSLESMKQFAKGLIGQTFEDEIIEKSNSNLILIYIYFLVQIKKVPTQAIYEVIRFSMIEKDQPLKHQAIINKLKQDALQKFSELVKKNDLVNQKFVFKKVYQYEESLNVLKTNLCVVVKQEKEFYGCILTQIIDIDMLLDIGFKLIKNIKTLENQFQLLFKTNPQSNECDTIYNIFHKYVNYNKVRPKLYRREGQIMMQFLQSAEKIIYDPGSCVIQITLLQPRGNVIRYTRSFQKAIGFKDEEIQDQNINRFMPQIIANDHDLYLDNFVERGRINVVRNAVRVILGKTKSQFVVPINTRLRIEASPIEFGATALITPVNLTYGYMMLNEQGQIEELTQNLFTDVFEKHLGLDLDHVKGLDCLFFIPELGKIWESLFDDNFEKLDKRFDCQLILPQITKQMSRSLIRSRSNIYSKSHIQTSIAKQFENLPHENVVYQVSLHLMSLITINLKLVIVEIPEYKQLLNQKITSRQLLQLRYRSSQLINISSQNDIPSQKTDLILSSLNSPPGGILNECDLEYENLLEDIKMIEELKNQLATININSTAQNNQNDPFLLQNSDNQLEGRIIEFRNDPSEQSNEFSEADSDFKENQQDQNVQYNNGSVGSRSSQNNTTALKKQIKDCLSDSKGLGIKTKLFLILIYFLIISGFLINYLILYFNFEKIHENQDYENLPFQFSYYYNEFIIDQSFLEYDQFSFSELSRIAFQYFLINIKNIDKTIALLPHINMINNLTLESRILNIMSQLTKVLNMNESINQNEFYNNTKSFDVQISEIENTDSTKNLLSLSIFVIIEEILLFILLGQYIYFCIQIVRMKQKIYKLFCTFSKEVIQDQFVQFSSLYTQLNNTRFRNHETDEEQFETTMMRQYQKTVTSNMLDKHNRVGKQISQKQTNSVQIFFFLFIFIYAFICSCYFIGSYILQQITQQSVSARYQEKTTFSITFNSLTSTFAQQAILINNTATTDMVDYFNNAVQQLGLLTTNLSLYQEDQNSQVYGILVENLCNLFLDQLSYSYLEYQMLFTLQQCQQISILDQGLSSVVQHLYSQQLDFLQSITATNLNTSIKQNYEDPAIQVERLYVQYGFQVIIELLTNQIISLIDSTFLINTIMFVFACIIMSVSLIATKITIEKVKQQYQLSKQLLTLFPFDKLMENAYVISFITHDLHFSI